MLQILLVMASIFSAFSVYAAEPVSQSFTCSLAVKKPAAINLILDGMNLQYVKSAHLNSGAGEAWATTTFEMDYVLDKESKVELISEQSPVETKLNMLPLGKNSLYYTRIIVKGPAKQKVSWEGWYTPGLGSIHLDIDPLFGITQVDLLCKPTESVMTFRSLMNRISPQAGGIKLMGACVPNHCYSMMNCNGSRWPSSFKSSCDSSYESYCNYKGQCESF